MNTAANNALLRTPHKGLRPENADVGLKYMRPLSIILILLCSWTCGCTTVLSEKERTRLSEVLVEDNICEFFSSFPQFKTNQHIYVAIDLTPDRKWIPPSSNLINRIQERGIKAVSIEEADGMDVLGSGGAIFFSQIEWNQEKKVYEWHAGRALRPDRWLSGGSGEIYKGFGKWKIKYKGGWTGGI